MDIALLFSGLLAAFFASAAWATRPAPLPGRLRGKDGGSMQVTS